MKRRGRGRTDFGRLEGTRILDFGLDLISRLDLQKSTLRIQDRDFALRDLALDIQVAKSRIGAPPGPRKSKIRLRDFRPALWRLRAVSRLGAEGTAPVPAELLPMGARVLAQGYLNRVAMPLLTGWLLPRWMREQSDPASSAFVPRSVHNVMVNQTARNWTALGFPGPGHPVESIVDRWGLLTPVPGGPSLDWWVELEGGDGPMAPSRQEVEQRLQDGLPVVETAFEAGGLRASSEVWLCSSPSGDRAAMRVVLSNIGNAPLKGTFRFALRPYNPEGISPIYHITYQGSTLRADGRPGPLTWPPPESWRLSGLASGDLFNEWRDRRGGSRTAPTGSKVDSERTRRSLYDPHGLAHGVLEYSFAIEPGEEAELLALMPTQFLARGPGSKARTETALDPVGAVREPPLRTLDWESEWRGLLDGGMRLSLPDRELQASWEANRFHLLALHDGDTITPGPDLYHSFWFRDAAYMAYALSTHGYVEAARQLLAGFLRRQRRNGSFVSQSSEWDSTGQVLWAFERHLALHPDVELETASLPAMALGARWIRRALRRSGGMMPPGISSEHFGPPDRYYWDNLWSLAGLRAAARLTGDARARRAASELRKTLTHAWEADASMCGGALPAAHGRNIDLGAVGVLAAWYPLGLLTAGSPYLEATLCALEKSLFHEGALFVNTGHSGWGTYLNMRIAGCYLLLGSEKGWDLMRWLLRHASPTYNWPEAIHPRTGGGSAGDGHHGWASAEWLLLVRSLLFREEPDRLYLTPSLPASWLLSAGRVSVERAPTSFGSLGYELEWDPDARNMSLALAADWRKPPAELWWKLPTPTGRVFIDGSPAACDGGAVLLPASAKRVEVTR